MSKSKEEMDKDQKDREDAARRNPQPHSTTSAQPDNNRLANQRVQTDSNKQGTGVRSDGKPVPSGTMPDGTPISTATPASGGYPTNPDGSPPEGTDAYGTPDGKGAYNPDGTVKRSEQKK